MGRTTQYVARKRLGSLPARAYRIAWPRGAWESPSSKRSCMLALSCSASTPGNALHLVEAAPSYATIPGPALARNEVPLLEPVFRREGVARTLPSCHSWRVVALEPTRSRT